MKKTCLIILFMIYAFVLSAQTIEKGDTVYYYKRGSTSFLNLGAMQSILQSRLFKRANYLLESRDYVCRNGIKQSDGSWRIYYSKTYILIGKKNIRLNS